MAPGIRFTSSMVETPFGGTGGKSIAASRGTATVAPASPARARKRNRPILPSRDHLYLQTAEASVVAAWRSPQTTFGSPPPIGRAIQPCSVEKYETQRSL